MEELDTFLGLRVNFEIDHLNDLPFSIQ